MRWGIFAWTALGCFAGGFAFHYFKAQSWKSLWFWSAWFGLIASSLLLIALLPHMGIVSDTNLGIDSPFQCLSRGALAGMMGPRVENWFIRHMGQSRKPK